MYIILEFEHSSFANDYILSIWLVEVAIECKMILFF